MPGTAHWTNATPPHVYGHVLQPDELLARATYRFAEPAPGLARWVERYWSVQWRFGPDEVFRATTLDDPSVNLTVERGGVRRAGTDGAGAWVTGPVTRGRFDVELSGSGSVVGVKLRVGEAAAFSPQELHALRDTTIPASDWFGEDLPGADLAEDAVSASGRLDAWLTGRRPRDAEGCETVREVLALLEDPSVTSMSALEERAGLSARSLQRLFARFVGAGPKRMLVRSRVMDAIAAIDRGDERELTEIAYELGWYDQSHFIRDVRSIIGETPGAYARRRHVRLREPA